MPTLAIQRSQLDNLANCLLDMKRPPDGPMAVSLSLSPPDALRMHTFLIRFDTSASLK
jgi:hypothetical protein